MRELSLNVMDIVQNSISAKAKYIQITILENRKKSVLSIEIEDDGKGMSKKQVENVQDPFFTTRTTRKVGLGVPLFKMAAEQTGGAFRITSKQGVGTVVCAEFVTNHMDMTPLGDINATVSLLIQCNPEIDFLFVHSIDENKFSLDTKELRTILGDDVSLSSPDVTLWIQEYLREQHELLFGGATNP